MSVNQHVIHWSLVWDNFSGFGAWVSPEVPGNDRQGSPSSSAPHLPLAPRASDTAGMCRMGLKSQTAAKFQVLLLLLVLGNQTVRNQFREWKETNKNKPLIVSQEGEFFQLLESRQALPLH